MPDYILRNVEDGLWEKFRKRAATEGHPLRWILIELVKHYVKHGLPD